MQTLKKDWLIWIFILVPYIIIALFWNKFPELIPTHFGLDGRPDDYSGKAFGLFFLPTTNLIMYFLFIIMPMIDPSRKNYGLFRDKYKIIRVVIHIFLSFVFLITAAFSLGYQFNLSIVIPYSMLVLFLILGNYMGNVRHNYFIGIRTPWTLANEEVWTSTHRLAAKLWVAGSLLMMMILPFLQQSIGNVVFLVFITVISMVPILYSYLEFRKIMKNN